MANENEDILRVKEKVVFFMEAKINVHIKLRDKTFLNGTILRQVSDGVYRLQERKLGLTYLFLKDVYEVKEFTEDDGWVM